MVISLRRGDADTDEKPGIYLDTAVNLALHRAMEEDERVMVFGEDVGKRGGVFSVTTGLQKRFGVERCFDTPLAENLLGGMTVGLAAMGKKPVVEFQFADFSSPAFSQIYCHAIRWRTRTQGRQSCSAVIRMPIGGSGGSPELHSGSPEAFFAHMPGLRVVIPSSPERAYGLLLSAIADPDPVVFLEPLRLYSNNTAKEEVQDDGKKIPLDRCFVLREGSDITIVTWGASVLEALRVAETLAGEGISIEVIDVASITYIDIDTLAASVHKTGRCVIVHEAPRTSGFAAEIHTQLGEKGISLTNKNFRRVTGYDTVYPLAALEEHYLPDEYRILKAARTVLLGSDKN